jgi:DNA-binding GntR family transcriptional regulator
MTLLLHSPTDESPHDEGVMTIDAARRQSQSKRVQICQRLRTMILSGRYRPGSRLGQEAISKQFRVAQGVVREALIQLAQFSLVESSDRRGAYVARLDKDRLLEALELRAIHEGLAARLCSERVTRLEVRAMMELINQLYELGDAGKTQEADALDRQLHKRLVQLSGNSMLIRLADNYWLPTASISDDRNARLVRDEHRAILKAIESGDAEEAEERIRRHINALCDGLRKMQ